MPEKVSGVRRKDQGFCAVRGFQEGQVDGWRLPARAIEEVVLNGIHDLLCNRARLIEVLYLAGHRMKVMLSEASSLADRILKAGPSEQREVLLEMVTRIEVRQDRIRIILRADRMREMIGQSETNNAHERIEGELKLDLPVSFKRRGVEMKLVTSDDRNPGHSRRPPTGGVDGGTPEAGAGSAGFMGRAAPPPRLHAIIRCGRALNCGHKNGPGRRSAYWRRNVGNHASPRLESQPDHGITHGKRGIITGPYCGRHFRCGWVVEPRGIEPLTSTLRTSRSPN